MVPGARVLLSDLPSIRKISFPPDIVKLRAAGQCVIACRLSSNMLGQFCGFVAAPKRGEATPVKIVKSITSALRAKFYPMAVSSN
jgi:hypothetical protein